MSTSSSMYALDAAKWLDHISLLAVTPLVLRRVYEQKILFNGIGLFFCLFSLASSGSKEVGYMQIGSQSDDPFVLIDRKSVV